MLAALPLPRSIAARSLYGLVAHRRRRRRRRSSFTPVDPRRLARSRPRARSAPSTRPPRAASSRPPSPATTRSTRSPSRSRSPPPASRSACRALAAHRPHLDLAHHAWTAPPATACATAAATSVPEDRVAQATRIARELLEERRRRRRLDAQHRRADGRQGAVALQARPRQGRARGRADGRGAHRDGRRARGRRTGPRGARPRLPRLGARPPPPVRALHPAAAPARPPARRARGQRGRARCTQRSATTSTAPAPSGPPRTVSCRSSSPTASPRTPTSARRGTRWSMLSAR